MVRLLRSPRLLAALAGLLSAAVAVGIGEVIAGLVRPAASPVIVVGNRMILLTPESVRRWAISVFGTNDKHALLTGIYVAIGLASLGIGALAYRRLAAGLVALGLFGGFGAYCALTTHAHRGSDAVPSIAAGVAGIGCLAVLIRSLRPRPAEAGVPSGVRRRSFLQAGAFAAALAAFSGLFGRNLQRTRYDASAARAAIPVPSVSTSPAAPAATYDLGKSGIPFVIPNDSFYRIDTALSIPQLNPKTWNLRIHGLVEREITFTYDQLRSRPLIERWITLACVSNDVGGDLIGNARFLGVRLADLLEEAGVHPGADQLLATSADGMTIGSPTAVVMDGRDAMLAIGMNGELLPVAHGFPVRMVVPGLYGYVSACKWITDLEVTTFARQSAYWVAEGWAQRGPVLLESRIDFPRSSASLAAGSRAAIAGVAWDQHVGVSKVEVQVDNGQWQQADLAPVPSTDTWRQWVLPWTVPPVGVHTLRVRATDAKGVVQTDHSTQPFPSGATGWHTISVRSR
ncbi:molybdopterin-dependent oxidoreductase [Jatrophihabitans telluris]|uniref:Molybdopterin-dependent oxidoreductase n=1 Tax=Jatrophihabitans telluris TaxID=2038343 RepID=A0ABY4QS04_9ACTN|nr:molybdopterin-dependent oxidoreductase [Jatrophihabitans telluris]UQX86630.1 molybdopterin-dependent oxidoreductase [Jatrophihabitans telluris]